MEILGFNITQAFYSVVNFFKFDPVLLSDPDIVFQLGLQVVLLLCSAFFSSSETALFSLSRLDLQQLRREKNSSSEVIHELLDQPRRLIMSLLAGNELVNIASSINMAGILFHLYGDARAGWINLIVMVPLLLLFCEVTPKTIAVANPVRYSTRIVARPLSIWVQLVAPVQWVIRGVADKITTLFVGEVRTKDSILEVDEFLTLVEQVAEEGVLDATERALIYNLLEANETEIVEMMIPRTQVAFLNVDMPIDEMIEKFISYRHTRVPVFKTHRDNLVGFLHAEDIMRLVMDDVDLSQLTPEDIMHPPVIVPLTKKVDEMFDFFQDNQVRAAACLNEFGGVEGFITIHGVVSFIFGDISGGSKEVAEHYRIKDDNIYEVPGAMRLTDFNNLTNFGIEDPRMTTIGGVAFRYLDRLPNVGDRVSFEDVIIEIVAVNDHRIVSVRISKGIDEEDFDEAFAKAKEEAETGDDAHQARDSIDDIDDDVTEAVEEVVEEAVETLDDIDGQRHASETVSLKDSGGRS